MMVAFIKFIRIVSRTHDKRDFNRWYIALQIIGLALWIILWITAGIYIMIYKDNLSSFNLDFNILIIDTIGFVATLMNFGIIALVIYKQSIVAGSQNQTYPR